jgi:uncharacterized protein YbjT (DUF2867 family)
MSIVVTTPTGHVGSRVVERLLAAGAPTTVLARDPGKLPAAVREQAAVHQGDLADAGALRAATRGARALFLVVPPHMTTHDWAAFQLDVGRAAADAVRANGVERVVFLSSAGAQRDDMYAVTRLGAVERLLGEAAPHVLALRAAFFYENFLAAVPTMAGDGAVYLSLPPERRIAMVAARDIGDVAAEALLGGGWSGTAVRGVHGAADLSVVEATAAIAEATGRAVRYVQVPPAAATQALLAMGASAHVADEYPKLFEAIGRLDYQAEPRTAETTTPTTFAQWAREVFAPAVAGVPGRAAAGAV